MHEIAVAAASAGVLLVLAASSLPEISDGGEFRNNGPASVESPHQALHSTVRLSVLQRLPL